MNTQPKVARERLVYRWRGTKVESENYLPFSSRLHRRNKALARETQLRKPEKSWRIFVFPENCSYEGFSPTTWPAPRWPDNLVGRAVMRSIFFFKIYFRNCGQVDTELPIISVVLKPLSRWSNIAKYMMFYIFTCIWKVVRNSDKTTIFWEIFDSSWKTWVTST